MSKKKMLVLSSIPLVFFSVSQGQDFYVSFTAMLSMLKDRYAHLIADTPNFFC